MTVNMNKQHKMEINGKTYTKAIIVILLLTIVFLAGNWYGTTTIKGNNKTLDNSVPTITPQVKKRVEQKLNEFTGGFIGQGSNGDPSIQYFIQNPSMSVGFGLSTIKMLIKGNNEKNSFGYTKISQTFLNSNPVNPKAINPIATHSTYFIGSNIGTTKPEFSTIIYKNLYNHIDLKYTIKNGELKYNFYVNPGGNPGVIQLQWNGPVMLQNLVQGMQITITTHTGQKTLLDKKPVSIQPNGISVQTNFIMKNVNTYGFKISKYNVQSLLIIDPSFLLYSSYFGGTNYGGSSGIAVDAAGNIYVAGTTSSSDFPLVNAYDSSYGGSSDVFVFKLSATDLSVVYSTYISGTGFSQCNALAVDSNGHAYVTGYTSDTNFPMVNAFNSTFGGYYDVFVTKLSETGTRLIYSTYFGGSGPDQGEGIAVDSFGNAFVTGITESLNFPTYSPYGPIAPGGGNYYDTFVFCLGSSGMSWYYSTYLGGSNNDYAKGIAIDSYDNVYVTGYTQSTNFPTTTSAFNRSFSGGSYDAFVFKLSNINYVTSLDYSTFVGGSSDDNAYSISVDSNNNTYVTGVTASTNFPTTVGAYNRTISGQGDAFVFKLSGDGSSLVYSTFFGGTLGDYAYSIVNDKAGNAYVSGYTYSRNLPLTSNAYDNQSPSYTKAMIFEISSSGSSLLYSSYIGGYGYDYAFGIARDANGNIFSTGHTQSTNFPVTSTAYENTYTSTGNSETFVFKLAIPSTASLTPSQPMVISSNATKSLGLFWNAPTFLESFQYYNIYRGVSAGNYSLIGTSPDSHFIDYSITPDVTYHYAVVPVYTSGSGYKSADVSGVLLSTPSTGNTTPTTMPTSSNTSKGLPGFDTISLIFLLTVTSVIILTKRKKNRV